MTSRPLFCLFFLFFYYSCLVDNGPRAPRQPGSQNGKKVFLGSPSPHDSSKINLYIPDEASHCQWFHQDSPFPKTSKHLLGGYSVCQGQSDMTDIFFQLQQSSHSGEEICIVPIHQAQGQGNTPLYIGYPKCKRIYDSSEIHQFYLSKDRENFETFSITGVLIMRDTKFYYPSPYNKKIYSSEAYHECLDKITEESIASYCTTFHHSRNFVYEDFSENVEQETEEDEDEDEEEEEEEEEEENSQ